MIRYLDLRSITRNSDIFQTDVTVKGRDFQSYDWITAGTSSIYFNKGKERATLKIPLDNVHDYEFDSAYAVSIDLLGLSLEFVSNGWSFYSAVIDPTSGSFNPNEERHTSFNVPVSIEELTESIQDCDTCENDCRVSELYVPKYNHDLFVKLAGLRLQITMGPVEGGNK